MPHLNIKTNVPKSKIPADLTKKLGEAVAKSMGKPLNYFVVSIEGDYIISHGGTSDPAAQATLMSIGALGVEQNKKYSKVISDIVAKDLGVAADKMYIHFIDAKTSDVGYNGTTFHEIFGS